MTRPEARRVYTPEEKVRLVAETHQPGETVQGVSRRHGVCASLLHRWRRAARGEAARKRRPPPRLLPVRLVAPGPAPPPAAPPSPAPSAPSASRGTRAPIEIVLRNGRVLRLTAEADAAAVARLAAALEA